MSRWKKIFFLACLVAITAATPAIANTQEDKATRGLRLEGTDLLQPPALGNAPSVAFDENETVARIRAFRAAPFLMKGYEKELAAKDLYEALSQCIACSAETLFAGFSDLTSFYTYSVNVPPKSGESAINVARQGADRIAGLTQSDDTNSYKISPKIASHMILRLIKLLPKNDVKDAGSIYETYLAMSQKSGSSELHGQALGLYLIWSLQHGSSQQPLALLDRLLALPQEFQLIPIDVHYKKDGTEIIKTDADWSNLIKAIAYARGGQLDNASIYFAAYRGGIPVRTPDTAGMGYDTSYDPSEFLRGEALYFSVIGDKFSQPLGLNGREKTWRRGSSRQSLAQDFQIIAFRSVDLDAELNSYWQSSNCRDKEIVVSSLCPVDEAFQLLNNNLNPDNYMRPSPAVLREQVCSGSTNNHYLQYLQQNLEKISLYDASLIALHNISLPHFSDDSGCEKAKSKTIRSLTGEEAEVGWLFDGEGISKDEFMRTEQVIMPPLAADEAFIQFHATDKHVYIWAATAEKIDWKRLAIGRVALRDLISELRAPLTFAEDKPFDSTAAWRLYKLLFSEIEGLVNNKTKLHIVANEPLSSLPFNILVKREPANTNYRDTHWLVKDHAVTIFTSLDALVYARTYGNSACIDPLLCDRTYGRNRPNRQAALVAYYDPAFSIADMNKDPARLVKLAGISGTKANLDSGSVFAPLESLPGTKSEISLIKSQFRNSAKTLIFGRQASETDIKKRDLSAYNIIYFATHGLTGAQLEPFTFGTVEPGLVLSNPSDPSLLDDGVLQESEIYKLKLDADLVVLSGCNTGTNGGSSQEPISGLAAAFLKAGARSIIATHWEISDAESARVMAGVFETGVGNVRVETSAALQKSILSYLSLLKDDSILHPRYWAPFFVINASISGNDTDISDNWTRICETLRKRGTNCNGTISLVKSDLNCTEPNSPSEAMICGDPQLIVLHRKMYRLDAVASTAMGVARTGIFANFDEWRQKQSNCRTEKCLRYQYLTKIESLNYKLANYKSGSGYALESRKNFGEWEIRYLALGGSSDAVDRAKCEQAGQEYRTPPPSGRYYTLGHKKFINQVFLTSHVSTLLTADDAILEYRCVSRQGSTNLTAPPSPPLYAPNWTKVSETTSGTIGYYDASSIHRAGNTATVWEKWDRSADRTAEQRQRLTRTRFDCASRTATILAAINYFPSGTNETALFGDEQVESQINPETFWDNTLRAVCGSE
jgi:CHAT domain-containing protein